MLPFGGSRAKSPMLCSSLQVLSSTFAGYNLHFWRLATSSPRSTLRVLTPKLED
jgi:hypothetical protein